MQTANKERIGGQNDWRKSSCAISYIFIELFGSAPSYRADVSVGYELDACSRFECARRFCVSCQFIVYSDL